MALLRISNLHKTYTISKTQKQDVLKGVNIEFKSGDLVALLGESGSGKSTLINILGGLDMDYTGSIVIKGDYIRDFTEDEIDNYRKKRVGLIFQNYNLIGHSTILENVELAMAISDIDANIRHGRAMDLLKMVGLGNMSDKYPSQLSGGQKQRVAIARALANNPTIILADEPTGALDKDSADLVMRILKKISESGKLVIIVTHSEKVAKECGRVIRLDNGVIVDDKVINKFTIDKSRDKEIVPKKMKRKDLFKQSIKNIKRNTSRSMLTSIGMAVGITAMLLILCLSGGLVDYVNKVYGEAYKSKVLEVYASDYTTLSTTQIDAVREVEGVSKIVTSSGLKDIAYQYGTESGITNVKCLNSYTESDVLYGSLEIATGETIIGVNMAEQLSSNSIIEVIGQTINITYNSKIHSFVIKGIYDNDNTNLCYISKNDIDYICEYSSYANNIILVTLKDVTYIDSATSDIKSIGLRVVSGDSPVSDILAYIDLGTSVLTGVGAISMVVSALMIFIVLYISVSERIKEIGIMRSIGARKKDIQTMFIYEAGIMGLIGGTLAVVACILLSSIVNIVCNVTIKYMLIEYNILYYIFGILLSVGISILAGIAPSKRASNLDPVECLRSE